MYVHTGHRSHKHNLLSPSHAVPSLSSVPRHSLQSNMSTHVKVFLFMPLVVVAFPAIESSRFEYPRTVLCRSQGGGQVCIWRGNVFILFFNLYDKTKWKTLFERKHGFFWYKVMMTNKDFFPIWVVISAICHGHSILQSCFLEGSVGHALSVERGNTSEA